MKKKLHLFIIFLVLLVVIQTTSCNHHDNINDSIVESKSNITRYSYEDIYGHDYTDEIVDPSFKRVSVYPTESCIYSFFTLWNRSYINDNKEVSTYSICQDSLCDHNSLPCISYASIASSNLIESNGKLYFLIQRDNNKEQFIEYNPEVGEYVVIEEFDNGGQLLSRLGRFIYFYIIRVDGETESGKLLTTRIIYRYDISESKLEKINSRSPDDDLRLITGYNGYIYYINTYGKLIRCDENMQNDETIISDNRVEVYKLTNNYIYYMSKESNSDYGTLYSLDLSNNKNEILYNNVTWFCVENNVMYYSPYEPIEAFEWDFPNYDSGVKKIEQRTITVMNGNKIYSVDLKNAGIEQGTLLTALELMTNNDYYLGEVYAIYNGFIFTQLKEAYSDNNKKGMITGTTAISIDTGDIFRIETEYVIYS